MEAAESWAPRPWIKSYFGHYNTGAFRLQCPSSLWSDLLHLLLLQSYHGIVDTGFGKRKAFSARQSFYKFVMCVFLPIWSPSLVDMSTSNFFHGFLSLGVPFTCFFGYNYLISRTQILAARGPYKRGSAPCQNIFHSKSSNQDLWSVVEKSFNMFGT